MKIHFLHRFFFLNIMSTISSLVCCVLSPMCDVLLPLGEKKKKSVYFLYFKRENYIHWPPGISEISNCSINSPISYNHPDVSVRLNGLYTCFIILVKFLLVKF